MSVPFPDVVARTLLDLKVKVVFGIVGIPVIEVCEAIQKAGIQFIGFRNEQSAAYAASAYGYLTRTPGVCIVVGGPGVVHAMAGVFNASANRWPLLLMAGSSGTSQRYRGAFQELDQVAYLSASTKLALRPPAPTMITASIHRAYCVSINGTPGPCYVDLPADFIQSSIQESSWEALPCIPRALECGPDPNQVQKAVLLLKSSKSPLIVIGKGASYAHAEEKLLALIEQTNVPFLPTPMGKGLLPENHRLNFSSARSTALKNADLVLLVGARLNWLLHFGFSPRWSKNAKFIQIDSTAEELGNNAGDVSLGIWSDINLALDQLISSLQAWNYCSEQSLYLAMLQKHRKRNESKKLCSSKKDGPLHMEDALTVINNSIQSLVNETQRNVTWVSEGANTLDKGRKVLEVTHPRGRLDSGTMATMGVGLGYSIAASVANPWDKIVAVEGDSAFGFSAMELETAIRSRLDLLIIVINNNGVYHGLDDSTYEKFKTHNQLPTTALSPAVRYDLICEACGGKGYFATNVNDLKNAIQDFWRQGTTCLINVMVDPEMDKILSFAWMNDERLNAKL
ncbi:oxalyl-CoA decarboxylase [Schizosaccharomyces cryophilus OY26]|uniref:2-hydroxyacyl-CoA lyase n=1 Tax=Schizosaccharomyces cryophilus (strain OY26 / ATCC MYA-4695 / CBS 11777 / NBRC 106824 / NRRL Y48691) TaxID=653667 RepID=S9VTG9_SCHCR|nr:oxalyl-CoA decarboxylase [Schizosaccharomyces cryophilus OY26]EPY49340.1 oxalyl-CoA decarboxylase [Schizosaccharomyces cryophilus OY26]